MTREDYHRIESKAYENVDFYYFQQMVKEPWVATSTSSPDTFDDSNYISHDVTVSNGEKEYVVELKGRKKLLDEKMLQGGCLVDVDKIEELEKFEKAAVVQFFPLNNRTFVWDVSKKDGWKYVSNFTTPFENGSERKIKKDVWFMPFNEENERDIDISDYQERLENEIKRLTPIYLNNKNN